MSKVDEIRFEIVKRIDSFIETQYRKLGRDNLTTEMIFNAWYKSENLQGIFNCKIRGHIWEKDICGIPEHQYCLLCFSEIDEESLKKQREEMNESSGSNE